MGGNAHGCGQIGLGRNHNPCLVGGLRPSRGRGDCRSAERSRDEERRGLCCIPAACLCRSGLRAAGWVDCGRSGRSRGLSPALSPLDCIHAGTGSNRGDYGLCRHVHRWRSSLHILRPYSDCGACSFCGRPRIRGLLQRCNASSPPEWVGKRVPPDGWASRRALGASLCSVGRASGLRLPGLFVLDRCNLSGSSIGPSEAPKAVSAAETDGPRTRSCKRSARTSESLIRLCSCRDSRRSRSLHRWSLGRCCHLLA